MINTWQIIFSLLGWLLQRPDLLSNVVHERKSIAVVGAGSAGLAMLKTLLDMPEHNSWNIVLFEERENVGGVW
jgi:NADPH-dependent glutamate synthase beta subunit-like oxidoreductase